MNTMKTLMLAAATKVMTLGLPAPMMAQSEVPSAPEATYFSGHRHAAPKIINEGSGSSDVNTLPGGAPVHFDYSDLANPG